MDACLPSLLRLLTSTHGVAGVPVGRCCSRLEVVGTLACRCRTKGKAGARCGVQERACGKQARCLSGRIGRMEGRPARYACPQGLHHTLQRVTQLPQCLAREGDLLRPRGPGQHLLNRATKYRDRAGFVQPRAATLRQKRLMLRRAAIPSEKNHPRAERRRPLPQVGIERPPVELGHPQVTQDHVIALPLERGEGVPAIRRRLHDVAVPLEQPGQRADQARLIVNDQNLRRRGRGHPLPGIPPSITHVLPTHTPRSLDAVPRLL